MHSLFTLFYEKVFFMKYYLGIDGGGTRTTAAVSDENGNIIYKATGKTINFYSVGMDASRKNLAEIMNRVYDEIGDIIFEGAFVGCSALDDKADDTTLEALCGGIIKANKTEMNSDAYVALFSGDSRDARCVVICGTGSMAVGVNACGKIIAKGGWGHVIGDGGSAYSIAVSALSEAVNLYDENRFNEPLVKSAAKFFKNDDLRKIIDIVYSESTTKDVIADFARSVAGLCAEGDKKAKAILENECKKLVRTVSALVDEIEGCKVLYLYGGVFQHNSTFRALFETYMTEKHPAVKTELLTVTPEEGALKIARDIV